jgi:hypothetical protein
LQFHLALTVPAEGTADFGRREFLLFLKQNDIGLHKNLQQPNGLFSKYTVILIKLSSLSPEEVFQFQIRSRKQGQNYMISG